MDPSEFDTCVYIDDSSDKVHIDFKSIQSNIDFGFDYFDSFAPILRNIKYSNKSKINDILTFLSFCDCCDKHQINKPAIFLPWVETPFSDDNTTICRCDCRHLARIICRQHNDYSGGVYINV